MAFGVAAAKPQTLRGLVAIASSAGRAEGLVYPAEFPILMISGARDPSFPIDDAREECRELSERGIRVKMAEAEDDHYLFLSRPQEFRNIIDTFCEGNSANIGPSERP